jgi:MoaA/NifB/PqqE/SkfB family radical SAM enzyme
MYLLPITTLHFEPTSACNARCPQCPRTFETSLETYPRLNIAEWNVIDLKNTLSHTLFKDLKTVLINGNFGDIVMHTNPKSIIEVFVDLNLEIKINTTGSAQSLEFWEWLGKQPNVSVKFGIDGLEDTHHLYRRNTSFLRILQNAKSYIDAGGKAKWIMTLFKHNAHQIDECKKLAFDLKFTDFNTRQSTRFREKKLSIVDKNLEHSYFLEPYDVKNNNISLDTKLFDKTWYNNSNDVGYARHLSHPRTIQKEKVSCVAIAENSVFLSYDQRLWPCCHTAIGFEQAYKQNIMYDSLTEIFKDNIKEDYFFNNVILNSIDKILNHTMLFKKIKETWNTEDVCTSCIMNCKSDSHMYKEFQTSTYLNISEK